MALKKRTFLIMESAIITVVGAREGKVMGAIDLKEKLGNCVARQLLQLQLKFWLETSTAEQDRGSHQRALL